MDLTGAITPLCEGNSPVLLSNQILFEHPGDRKWLLCDLEGKNPHPLGDGLLNHAFPTPSPDGQSLLMLPFKPFASAPVLINLQAPVPHAIPLPAGLWTTPAWR